jgi:pyruvate/2-oxoglutarate dehydrogenase complex dihydrolipoamide dehydrogenase (E3) component
MEMSEALRKLGIETSVIVRRNRPAVRWDAAFTDLIVEELKKNGVSFLAETRLQAIEKGTTSRLLLKTDKGDVDADIVLMGLGVNANVDSGEIPGAGDRSIRGHQG